MGVSFDEFERRYQQIRMNALLRREEIRDDMERLEREVRRKQLKRQKRRKSLKPPKFGERTLLLILSKEERVNIPGDLAEEYTEIVKKQGRRFGNIWYWKQVTASMWPLVCKALRWGIWASIGSWIRRII
jgi:hypothetical protein